MFLFDNHSKFLTFSVRSCKQVNMITLGSSMITVITLLLHFLSKTQRDRPSFLYQTVKNYLFLRRVFWTRKSTYFSFILRYRVLALFRAVTASFNARRFDCCCCKIWNSKTTSVWRSKLEALITVMIETINHILSWETAVFFSAYHCYIYFFLS